MTSKVSVLRQNILFSGLLLPLLKNLTITVPWSKAWRICGISAPLDMDIRDMAGQLPLAAILVHTFLVLERDTNKIVVNDVTSKFLVT